jgi:hypothetical protein
MSRILQRPTHSNPPTFEAEPRDNVGRQMLSVAPGSKWSYDPHTGKQIGAASELEALRRVFGNPNKTITTQVGDSVPVENDDYLDAFMGKSKFTEQMIERVITAKDMSLVSEVFPFMRMESAIDISFQTVTMNNHLMRNAPEETGPALVTHQTSSSTISLDPRNIGAQQEKGFWKTERGTMMWAAQLRQIGNATKETAVLSAYTAVFGGQDAPEDPNEKYRVRNIDGTNMSKLISEETSQFGALNKRGAEMVLENAQRVMRSRRDGSQGDYALFPFGSQKYFDGPLFDHKFIDTGRPVETSDQALDRLVGKSAYREARGIKQGEMQPDLHLESQVVQIGNYFVMNHTGIQNVRPENYRSSMESVKIYDESSDRNVLISKIEAWYYSGLAVRANPGYGALNGRGNRPPTAKLSKFGRIYFGRFKHYADFFNRNDPEQYWLKTLLSKSAATQLQFANVVSQMLSIVNTQVAAGVLARMPVRSQNGTGSGMRSGRKQKGSKKPQVFSSMRTGDPMDYAGSSSESESSDDDAFASESDDAEDAANEYNQSQAQNSSASRGQMESTAAQSAWPLSVRKAALKFHDFLASIERKFPAHSLTKLYHDALKSMSSSDVHIDTVTWDLMSKQLLEIDEWQSASALVRNASSRSGLTATPFEEEFLNLSKTDAGASATQAMQRLRDASKMSPYWQPRDEGAVRLKVLAVPGDFDWSARPLLFPALSYTLSSQHLVLFCVEDDVLQKLRSSSGKVMIANSDAGSDLRDGLLQFSVALSAVYQLAADAAYNDYYSTFGAEIKKVVHRSLGSSSSSKAMVEASLYVKRQGLGPMYVQMWAAKVIQKIAAVLHKIYNTKKNARLDIDADAKDILMEVQACCSNESQQGVIADDDHDDQSQDGTASRMSRSRQRMGALMHQETMELAKRSQIQNFAQIPQESTRIVNAYIQSKYPNPAERQGDKYLFAEHQEAFENGVQMLLAQGATVPQATKFVENLDKSQLANTAAGKQSLVIKVFSQLYRPSLLDITELSKISAATETGINEIIKQRTDKTETQRAASIQALQDFATSQQNAAQPQASASGAVATTSASNAVLSEQVILDALAALPIADLSILEWMMRNDVYVPIAFVCARPFVKLQMGTAALLHSGGRVGHTYYANPMTEVGNDAVTMMVFVHLRMYLKTGIENPDKMILLRNILTQNYQSGNDTQFFDPLDADDVESFTSGESDKSIIVFAEDPSFDSRVKAIDITGEFHPSWHANELQARGTKLLLARAMGENYRWIQSGASQRIDMQPHLAQERSGRPNTFCLPCQCGYWNDTRGDYSNVFTNAGHYGPDAEYDGSGKVRNMQQRYYTPPMSAQATLLL